MGRWVILVKPDGWLRAQFGLYTEAIPICTNWSFLRITNGLPKLPEHSDRPFWIVPPAVQMCPALTSTIFWAQRQISLAIVTTWEYRLRYAFDVEVIACLPKLIYIKFNDWLIDSADNNSTALKLMNKLAWSNGVGRRTTLTARWRNAIWKGSRTMATSLLIARPFLTNSGCTR